MSDAKDQIRDVITSAPEAKRPARDGRDYWGAKAKHITSYHLPDDSPIIPLGVSDDHCFIIDEMARLRILHYEKLSKNSIMSLFGDRTDLVHEYWPRYSAPKNEDELPEIVGWRPEMAAQAIMDACSKKGFIDVSEKVRGPGCWMSADGQLVMHCGDKVYQNRDALEPGEIYGHVYPAGPPKPKPDLSDKGTDSGQALLDVLKSWSWRRPDLDPYLLLGWIGASILGGALDWRPVVWITGDKATGKSTLHRIIQDIHGHGGVISVTDPTAAGLWQSVGHASLPVAVDELEAEEDNRRSNNIIKLARLAASGSRMVRGGSDHRSTDFTLRNCFLFSSILIPPLMPQDVSRMAILQLDKLENGARPPSLEPEYFNKIGVRLRSRLIDQWPRMRDTLHSYQTMLAEIGHGGRGGDMFGTLLACCDMMLYDGLPVSDTLDEWRDLLEKSALAETEEDVADHDRCIDHMMTSIVDVYRDGKRRQIGAYIMEASGYSEASSSAAALNDGNAVLASYGMKVMFENGNWYLLVANMHQGLAQIFKDTHWSGRSGSSGVWVQALRRKEGAVAAGCIRFDGVPSRCTKIPFKSFISEEMRRHYHKGDA